MRALCRSALVGVALTTIAGSGLAECVSDAAQPFERRYVALEEGRLSFVWRPGKGPRLVLIPGSFNDSRQWDEVTPGFECGLELVLVELRGHGQSWPPPTNGSIEEFAEDVLLVTESLGYRSFYIGGHSIGGMVALEVGRKRPEFVRGIISLEGWTHPEVPREAFANRNYNTLTAHQEAERLVARERAVGHWAKTQREEFAQIWRRWDGASFLRQTDIPILEVYGDRASDKPTREQLGIPRRDNITLRWIENASHSLPLERPREVARLIMEFIQASEPR